MRAAVAVWVFLLAAALAAIGIREIRDSEGVCLKSVVGAFIFLWGVKGFVLVATILRESGRAES